MKDLSLIDEVNALEDMGVKSGKDRRSDEKQSLNVVTTIKAIKAAMDNRAYDINELRNAFSRDGFTKGYYDSKLGSEMFGTRKTQDLKKSIDSEQKIDQSDFYQYASHRDRYALQSYQREAFFSDYKGSRPQ